MVVWAAAVMAGGWVEVTLSRATMVGCGLTSGGDELEVAGVSCDMLCDVLCDVLCVVGMEAVEEVLPAERAPEMSLSYSSCILLAFSFSLAARSASAFFARTDGAEGKKSAYPARDMSGLLRQASHLPRMWRGRS